MVDDKTTAALKEEFSHFSTYKTTPAKAYDLIERARTLCPVPHSDELGGFYLFLNYEDVRAGLMDWRTYASSPSSLRPYVEGTPVFPPNSYDPPEHTPWRKVFSDGVNAATAARIEPQVRAYAIGCIESIAGRGQCDLATDLAERVPMNAIFYVMGLEEEHHERVRTLTLRTLTLADRPAEFAELFAEFEVFAYAEVEKRRANPRDDYLTVLGKARMGDRPLARSEIAAAVISLLVAGHGTTTAALVNLFYEVLRRPEVKQRLIDDPSLIPAAVEEGVRLHHPFLGLYRTATKNVTVGGAQIRKGDSILMCWAAGNRDPNFIEDPLKFRIDRKPCQHLAFGLGRHSCVGQMTARMEMRVVMEELLRILPDIELSNPGAVEWQFHGAESSAISHLPARFAPRVRPTIQAKGRPDAFNV
ncbi:MAG TPA: cytochrome P450 [Verrucomicrobiae bacterium]|nr:cytochrome P450 [Verrucomicrobiae bacterium]